MCLCVRVSVLVCICEQVMGHHNARLDPLGISCVNFDDAPVNTGFQDVGEEAAVGTSLSVC